MAITQDQVNAWFDANPNAKPEDVAAAVKSIGGLEANAGLSGMIANRFSIAEPEVTNYYNAYTAPTGGLGKVADTTTQANNQTTSNTISDQTVTGGLPTSNTTATTNTANTTLSPTLLSADGKEYAGDKLLKLVQQLGASTTADKLAGSAYGVKNGNIGFDYTEANKLFGNSNATQQVFLDAARGLLDQGVTDLSQLTTKDIMGDASVQPEVDDNGTPTGRYVATWGGDSEGLGAQRRVLTPEEASKVKSSTVMSGDSESTQYTPLNIALNKGIFDQNGKQISATNQLDLGSTYTGPGGTSYQLTFDPTTGKPAFKTTGFTTSDAAALGPLTTMASLAFPAAAPWIKAGMAAYNASQGNYTGALLSGLGAAGDFGALGAADIDALANSGNYSGAVNLYENSPLVQNLSNINLAKTGVSGLESLKTGNVPGVINAAMSGLNQSGVTLPSGVTTAVQLANLTSALTSNNGAAALNALGDLTGSANTKIAASAVNALNVLQNPNADPTALMNAVTNLSKAVNTANTASTTSGLTGTKVADAGEEGDDAVNSLIGDFSTKFANIEGNPTSQVAGNLTEMPGEKPSWLKLDKGEKIIGKDEEVGTGEKATYLVQIDNPEDADKPFIYQTYFDPKTGQTMYAPYGSMKTGGENLGEDVLIQSLGFKNTKPIPDWTASDAEKGLPSTVKLTDETFNKTGKTGGLPTTVADLASVLKTDGTGAKTDSTATSTVGGLSGDTSKSTVVGGLSGGDSGTTGDKGTKGTDGSGTKDGTGGKDGTGSKDGTGGKDGNGDKDGTGGKDGTGDKDGTGGDDGKDKTLVCGEGFKLSADGKSCVPIVKDDKPLVCGEGFHLSADGKSCIPNEKKKLECPEGYEPNADGTACVLKKIDTVINTPVVKQTTTSPLSSVYTPPPTLDTSEQMLKGAPAQKRMELAKLQQLFASLTPEMAAVLSERGFAPPKYKEDTKDSKEEKADKEEKSIFGNLSDELYKPEFMATGGKVFESKLPKFIEHPKHISAAPVVGTGGVDSPLKLAALRHLYQSIGKPMKPLGELAKGGLPQKYAEASPKGHKPEFITGLTGYYASGNGTGQSDDIPAMLHDGDYVIDADAVAALGDGSSKAGAEALAEFQKKVPHSMSSGGQAVPAKIADGEYVFPEAFVTAIGGGDNKQGAKRLDAMREELRAHKRSAPTSKIPPKAKSPLDYLRMAKG
jgi:hypothetical protein